MKKILPILLLLAAVSCKTIESPSENGGEETVTFSVSPSELSFENADKTTKYVSVKSSGNWTAQPSASWMHVNPTSGSGNGSFSVTVDDYSGSNPRTGSIAVSGNGKGTVSVSQGSASLALKTPSFDGVKRASTTYQLLIYSFADSDGDGVGDFKGIQEHLDYLDALGVTALWLSPAHPTNSYHAYDVNDYFSLNPLYGTETDFKNLIDAADAKGIKIYMDYVLNHSGKNNAWFKSVLSDPVNSDYKDYYVISTNYLADVSAGLVDNYGGGTDAGMGDWHDLAGGDAGYNGRLHFVLDSSTKRITVTKSDAAVDTPASTSDWYIYCGSFKGMKKTATNIYELTIDISTDWGFLVCSKNDWSSGSKYGASSSSGPIAFGTPYQLYTNADNDKVGNIVFGTAYKYFASFDQSMPDLNYGNYAECENSPAFKATVESAKKWVDMGVAGFRLDAVIWIYQAQLKANQRFLDQWYQAVNNYYKQKHSENIFMVGETWCDGGHNGEPNNPVKYPQRGGEKDYYKGLPSCFEFDYGYKLQSVLNDRNVGDFVSTISQYVSEHKAIRSDAITSFFLSNHDQMRFASSLGQSLEKEKQAAAILLTTPEKPYIYQGEELGYWGNQNNGDEYVRAPIVWDAAATKVAKNGVNNKVDNAMLKGSISVETQSADENSLLNVYKTWSRLRNTYPALASGEMSTSSISDAAIAAWYMTSGSQKLLVIHNVASAQKEVSVSDSMDKPVALLGTASTKNGRLILGPNSSVVFEL